MFSDFTESLVDAALARIGYVRFTDSFDVPEKIESPDNYQDGVAIELKTLATETFENPKRIDRIGEVLREVSNDGENTELEITVEKVGERLYFKYWDTIFDGLNAPLRKARSQIRSAKKNFEGVEAGVLYLVNVECDSFKHQDLHSYTVEVISRKYPEIDALITHTLIPQVSQDNPGNVVFPTDVFVFSASVKPDVLLEIPDAIMASLIAYEGETIDELPDDLMPVRRRRSYAGSTGNTYTIHGLPRTNCEPGAPGNSG
jgi:hypothetical protein